MRCCRVPRAKDSDARSYPFSRGQELFNWSPDLTCIEYRVRHCGHSADTWGSKALSWLICSVGSKASGSKWAPAYVHLAMGLLDAHMSVGGLSLCSDCTWQQASCGRAGGQFLGFPALELLLFASIFLVPILSRRYRPLCVVYPYLSLYFWSQ